MEENRKIERKRGEEGQVIVFLALVLVGLMGFAALALDGGMLFSDRRHAQNAADSASLAGASAAAYYMRSHAVNYNAFICGTGGTVFTEATAEMEAINRAASNDYVIDADISDGHGVDVVCNITDMVSYEDKHIDIIQSKFPESRGKVYLIGKWIDNKEVPDPYKKNKQAFVEAEHLIELGLRAWQEKIWPK